MLKYIPKKKFLLLSGDFFIIITTIILAVYLRTGRFVNVPVLYTGATWIATFCYLLIFYIADLYNLDCQIKTTQYLARVLGAVIVGAGLVAGAFYFLPSWKYGRGIWLIYNLLISIFIYLWRLFFEWVFKYKRRPKNLLIIGLPPSEGELYETLKKANDYRLIGFVGDEPEKREVKEASPQVLGDGSQLQDLIETYGVEALVLDVIDNDKNPELLRNILECKMKGVLVYDMPTFYEELTGKVPAQHVSDAWLVYNPIAGFTRSNYLRAKRMFDIFLSFFGLLVSLPILLLTALAIKFDSEGPILYKQDRVGLNERDFTLIKFRSMKADAEKGVGPVWAEKQDPRVTRVGKIIRLFRIDEIPQLWNVLKGEMSLIGPRPERPEFVKKLKEQIPYYSLRHAVKPGATGWAQVNYQYGDSDDDAVEKLQYDLFYIRHLSPLLELRIILKTIRVVLFGIGAR